MSNGNPSSSYQEIENALRDLAPIPLGDAFLSRLEAAADGRLMTLTAAELALDKTLAGFAPSALSPDFMNRLESVVSGVPFAIDHKIVMFPKAAPASSKQRQKARYPMWAAAAAVALIGAASALLLPEKPSASPLARNSSAVAPSVSVQNSSSSYVAAGFNRGLGGATDEGVSWHQAGQPQRIVRVTYIDHVTLKNAEGKTVEVEQPRTEYILVPEKMD